MIIPQQEWTVCPEFTETKPSPMGPDRSKFSGVILSSDTSLISNMHRNQVKILNREIYNLLYFRSRSRMYQALLQRKLESQAAVTKPGIGSLTTDIFHNINFCLLADNNFTWLTFPGLLPYPCPIPMCPVMLPTKLARKHHGRSHSKLQVSVLKCAWKI